MTDRNPVVGLMKIATKLIWESPKYVQVLECGPTHKKMYIFKVVANGNEYQPTIASVTKKEARANAALLLYKKWVF